MTIYYERWICGQIDRSQRMYVNIINYKTRRQNIIIDVVMSLNYNFVITKCKSL